MDMYLDLMKGDSRGRGWSLFEIDEMDIHYFFALTQYKASKETTYIDQLGWF